MTTYTLPTDGAYEFDPSYDYASHSLVASGSGSVVVEFRHPGSDVWRRVPGTLDASTGNIITFTGVMDQFRFTLSGSSGGATVTARTQQVQALESNLISGPDGFNRIRVDSGEPGFWYGRQFGVSYEFNIPIGGRLVLKFTTPIDAILYGAPLQVDSGDLYYRVFGFPNDSIETVAFTNPITTHPLNTMSSAPSYTTQVLGFDDGDIDETGLEPFPVARIRTADNSNFRASSTAGGGFARGFGAANAYIVLESMNGTATTGVLDLRFEDRDWLY